MERMVRQALRAAELEAENCGVTGFGVAITPKQIVPFTNLITTKGDEYHAKKVITSIAPASPAAPTAATGMKLGTSTTAASKSGAGAALVTYLATSNDLFDTGFPVATAVSGTDTGWLATYQVTWIAGVATSASINEVVIVNDAATNATSTAANTYARAIFSSTINKGSGQPLIVIWNHKFLAT